MLKWKFLLFSLLVQQKILGPIPYPPKGIRFDYDIKQGISMSFFQILSKDEEMSQAPTGGSFCSLIFYKDQLNLSLVDCMKLFDILILSYRGLKFGISGSQAPGPGISEFFGLSRRTFDSGRFSLVIFLKYSSSWTYRFFSLAGLAGLPSPMQHPGPGVKLFGIYAYLAYLLINEDLQPTISRLLGLLSSQYPGPGRSGFSLFILSSLRLRSQRSPVQHFLFRFSLFFSSFIFSSCCLKYLPGPGEWGYLIHSRFSLAIMGPYPFLLQLALCTFGGSGQQTCGYDYPFAKSDRLSLEQKRFWLVPKPLFSS